MDSGQYGEDPIKDNEENDANDEDYDLDGDGDGDADGDEEVKTAATLQLLIIWFL